MCVHHKGFLILGFHVMWRDKSGDRVYVPTAVPLCRRSAIPPFTGTDAYCGIGNGKYAFVRERDKREREISFCAGRELEIFFCAGT